MNPRTFTPAYRANDNSLGVLGWRLFGDDVPDGTPDPGDPAWVAHMTGDSSPLTTSSPRSVKRRCGLKRRRIVHKSSSLSVPSGSTKRLPPFTPWAATVHARGLVLVIERADERRIRADRVHADRFEAAADAVALVRVDQCADRRRYPRRESTNAASGPTGSKRTCQSSYRPSASSAFQAAHAS